MTRPRFIDHFKYRPEPRGWANAASQHRATGPSDLSRLRRLRGAVSAFAKVSLGMGATLLVIFAYGAVA